METRFSGVVVGFREDSETREYIVYIQGSIGGIEALFELVVDKEQYMMLYSKGIGLSVHGRAELIDKQEYKARAIEIKLS